MKIKYVRPAALLLALALAVSLTGCGGEGAEQSASPSGSPTASLQPTPSGQPSEQPQQPSDTDTPAFPDAPADVTALGAPTGLIGMGISKLLADIDELEEPPYWYAIADEDTLAAGLADGSLDAAILSPARALRLYHDTGGGVRIVAAALSSGELDAQLMEALRVSEGWDSQAAGSGPVVTVAVVRTQILLEQPTVADTFVTHHNTSVGYVTRNPEEAGELMEELALAADEEEAAQIVTRCGLKAISGAELPPAMIGFYEYLYQIDPAAMEGGMPDDGIYYYEAAE